MNDDEYAAIEEVAEQSGRPVEDLVRETVTQRFRSHIAPELPAHPLSGRELEKYFYRIEFTANLPTHEPDSPEEEAEEEELAQLLSKGKSLSEMIIEDRGPY